MQNTSTFFKFAKWNSSLGAVQHFNATLQQGHKDIGMIQTEMNALIGDDAISITTDSTSEAVKLSVVKGGYQIDFSASPGLSELMGFTVPFRMPSTGLLNEISREVGNNVLVFSFSPGGIEIASSLGNNFFRYRGWNPVGSVSFTYTAPIPDGIYSPSELAEELNLFASSVGHPADLFDFGTANLTYADHAILTLRYPGFVFIFSSSSQEPSPLGFAGSVPDASLYWQVTGAQLPNEISAAALNNRFVYEYIAGDGLAVQAFALTFPAGIYTLEGVQAGIAALLSSNLHPPDAVRLFTDAAGHVALQITAPGFRVRFAGSSVGRFLGFADQVSPRVFLCFCV